jgi:hypothetical protein
VTIKPVSIIGDIHGQYDKLVALLRESGLLDADLTWSGGDTHLWFTGDFLDRGPDGIRVVDLVMRLQGEAKAAGGEVNSLLGNHEVLFLGAYQFGKEQSGSMFALGWLRNGGIVSDMEQATPEQIAWLKDLPAMALVQDRLLVHADAMFYTQYGDSIEAVNRSINDLLYSDNVMNWHQLLDEFSERMTFFDAHTGNSHNARRFLEIFGGRQIIHGHTPIHYMELELRPKDIREPLSYAHNLCLNLDGGMYLGGSGFIYRLP